jgi:trimethylamine--corrinoid protein Co-methyltransferase
MMDYETCQSLEKLVIDDEICAMAYRLLEGITPRDNPIASGLLAELGEAGSGFDFLTHPHTLQWFREEQYVSDLVDRGKYGQWVAEGKPSLAARAHKRVGEILSEPATRSVSPDLLAGLRGIMDEHARRCGKGPVTMLDQSAYATPMRNSG